MAAVAKPIVVVTRRLPERVETRRAELFSVRLNETDEKVMVDIRSVSDGHKPPDRVLPGLR